VLQKNNNPLEKQLFFSVKSGDVKEKQKKKVCQISRA
jgi:hypothetical protein